jgi:hypothetical protein
MADNLLRSGSTVTEDQNVTLEQIAGALPGALEKTLSRRERRTYF